MTVGGGERGLTIPFLQDGIAQGFEQIPLVAQQQPYFTPGTTGADVARFAAAAARAYAASQSAPDFISPPIRATPPFPVAELVINADPPQVWPRRVPPPTYVAPAIVIAAPIVSFPNGAWIVSSQRPQAHRLRVAPPAFIAPAFASPPAAMLAPTISTILPDSLKQTLSWRTDILRKQIGTETRQALRGAPRERMELTYLVTEALVEQLRAYLLTLGASTIYVPAMQAPLAPLADITSNALMVDTSLTDALHAAGDKLLIANGADQGYLATVTGVSSSSPGIITATLDVLPPLGYSFPAATSTVYIAKQLVLDDGSKFGRYHVNASTFAISGNVKVPTLAPTGTGGSVTTFDGLPVMDRGMFQDDGQTAGEQPMLGLELLDLGGVFSMRTLQQLAQFDRTFDLMIGSAYDRQWLIAFAQGLLGMQGLFLLATGRPDLSLHTQPSVGATTLLINSSPDYVGVWWQSLAHRRLMLTHADGTIEYSKVSAAVDNGNGTQSLTVGALSGATVVLVSFLEQCRLTSDDVAIVWSATSGETQLAGRVVQQ